MNIYTIIAGVNGTGKSSLRGVLEGQGVNLGHIIVPHLIAKENQNDLAKAAKIAVAKIKDCLSKNISFTQETTLSGRTVLTTVKQAKKTGLLYHYVLHRSKHSRGKRSPHKKQGSQGRSQHSRRRRIQKIQPPF